MAMKNDVKVTKDNFNRAIMQSCNRAIVQSLLRHLMEIKTFVVHLVYDNTPDYYNSIACGGDSSDYTASSKKK
jgi:hypothetical protein